MRALPRTNCEPSVGEVAVAEATQAVACLREHGGEGAALSALLAGYLGSMEAFEAAGGMAQARGERVVPGEGC